MILLDTNVISEPMRPAPEQRVVQWIDSQSLETLYLSSISMAELRAGVAILPKGKRRRALDASLENTILPMFSGRVLSFDANTSKHYADIIAQSKTSGIAICFADALIASIARACNFAIATRDTGPFQAVEVDVINPWDNAG